MPFEQQLEKAEGILREQGHNDFNIERMRPLTIMGLKGHSNPDSTAVQNVADQIRSIDARFSVYNDRPDRSP